MNYLSLILRFFAIAAAIVAAFLYFSLRDASEATRQELIQLKKELQIVTDKNESSNLQVSELTDKLALVNQQVVEAQIRAEESEAEMTAALQESKNTKNKFLEAQKEAAELKGTATRLRKELINSEEAAAAASKEGVIAQLSDRIEELTGVNNDLKSEIQTLESSVQVDETTLANTKESSEEASKDAAANLEATQSRTNTSKASDALSPDAETESAIIASISKSRGLLVLNTSNPNIYLKLGSTAKVYKKSKLAATVKINNINNTLVITKKLPDSKIGDLFKGDSVEILFQQ